MRSASMPDVISQADKASRDNDYVSITTTDHNMDALLAERVR